MQAEIQVIRCPHCSEYVDARSAECRFCHGYIDTLTAQVAAETQQRVNDAYNEASWLRNGASAFATFAALRHFIPFLGLGGAVVLPLMFLALPVLLIRWRVRFGRLQTNDPDYPRAKQNWLVALSIWLLASGAWFVLVLWRGLAR